MQIFSTVIAVIQVLSALAVIGLVLVQHGKGADMGAAFGSGASGSLFGANGAANFLSRTTAILATIFFVSTLALAYLATNKPTTAPKSLMDGVTKTLPATGAVPPSPVPPIAAPAAAGRVPQENQIPK